MRWLDGITDSSDMNLSKLLETAKVREARCVAVHCVAELDMTEPQQTRAQLLVHVQLFATCWTVACQAPLFVGFFRQE